MGGWTRGGEGWKCQGAGSARARRMVLGETRSNFRLHVCWPHMSLKLTFAELSPPPSPRSSRHFSVPLLYPAPSWYPFAHGRPFAHSIPARLLTDHGTTALGSRNFGPRGTVLQRWKQSFTALLLIHDTSGNKCITRSEAETRKFIRYDPRARCSPFPFSFVVTMPQLDRRRTFYRRGFPQRAKRYRTCATLSEILFEVTSQVYI